MSTKLFNVFATAAMSVLALACAKEPVTGDGQTVEAIFDVDVPGVEVSTKGLSDAASVNELICQVFLRGAKDENKHFVYTPVPELTQNVDVVDGKASVKFSLVKGQTYSFAFWAQTRGTGYYTTEDLRSVTMNTELVKANDPEMDAFFAIKDDSRVTTSYSNKIHLKRALAQVNFGTKYSGRSDELTAQKSSVTLTGVPNVFHPFMSGDSFACEGSETVKFNENKVVSDESLSANGTEYSYLASAYVFALNPNTTITDASAVVTLNNGKTTTINAPNAPMKRNFRTNILGDLLTVDAEWNVDILPAFEGDNTYDAVSANLEKGATVTLAENYSVDSKSKGVTIGVGVTSVLNLNGKKFSNENAVTDNKAALQVHGDLTINGDGEVYCAGGADNNAIIVEQGGHLVINGGTYNVGANTNSGKSNATIFVMGPDKYGRNGSVEINGGVFMAKAGSGSDATPFVLNQYDDITVNCFSVKGGTFVGFNPASVNEAHGTITSFVAEGYKSVETTYEGKQAWEVVKIPAVTTQEGLNDEITNGTAGSQVTINLAKDATFTLNNGIANGGENAPEKNRKVVFLGDGTQTIDVITGAVNAESGQLSYQRGSSFTFKNITVKAGEGNFDGVVCDELVFENCTITGKLTLYGKASFKDCTFENTMANQYSIWTWGGTDVTFDKCTFNTNGKAILLYGGSSNKNPTNLVVTNCVFNDRNNGSAGKAAIEIGNDYNSTYSLTVNACTVNGFAAGKNTDSKLWANKNSMDAAHLSVTIDRVKIQ